MNRGEYVLFFVLVALCCWALVGKWKIGMVYIPTSLHPSIRSYVHTSIRSYVHMYFCVSIHQSINPSLHSIPNQTVLPKSKTLKSFFIFTCAKTVCGISFSFVYGVGNNTTMFIFYVCNIQSNTPYVLSKQTY